jgi:hypothetical protein
MSCVSVRCCALLAALMSIPLHGSAQTQDRERAPSNAVQVNPDGTVSVKSDGVPIGSLLEALRAVCPMEVRLEPKASARPVTIDISNLPPAAAVGVVLKASGLDFAMHTRCGTASRPALVVVREAGDTPIPAHSRELDSDNRQLNESRIDVALPLPVEPPPEREERDDPATRGGTTMTASQKTERVLAPGEVTAEQMVELLARRPAVASSNSAVIELPFTDDNGQPYLQVRPPKSGTVMLPFPDAHGNPIEVPVPAGPRKPRIDFPVYVPDPAGASDGQGTGSAAVPKNPADARRPGGGGSER